MLFLALCVAHVDFLLQAHVSSWIQLEARNAWKYFFTKTIDISEENVRYSKNTTNPKSRGIWHILENWEIQENQEVQET